jgi:hypothetical protein
MRDYMKVVRAKSAHPLGRKTHSASRIGLHTGHNQSMEKSMEKSTTSILHSSFTVIHDNKYEKSQILKDRKERLKSFTDKRLNNRQRRKNREMIEKIQNDLEIVKKNPDYQDRRERADRIRELRYSAHEKKEGEIKERIHSSIKKSKENAHKLYLDRFPPISNDVKELREKEHKDKYLVSPPLHQRLLKDFEEREERRLKEVKDQLHQLKVVPIDFVVGFYNKEIETA